MTPEPFVDTDAIVAELQRRVAQRRTEGKYPPGLEQQLDAEFAAILSVVHRGSQELENIESKLSELTSLAELLQNKRRSLFSRGPSSADISQILNLQVEVLRAHTQAIKQLRHGDLESLRQLNQLMQDRLMMIDPLAEAVVNLEAHVFQGRTE